MKITEVLAMVGGHVDEELLHAASNVSYKPRALMTLPNNTQI